MKFSKLLIEFISRSNSYILSAYKSSDPQKKAWVEDHIKAGKQKDVR